MTHLKARFSFRAVVILLTVGGAGCSIMQTRPVQEMSNTAAAIRAAKEVQADTLSPELYRQAVDWFTKARNEYKLKNFDYARTFADKSRDYAEQAEFDAVRGGGTRQVPPPPPAPGQHAEPYDYPTPTGTPAEEYYQRSKTAPGGGSSTPPGFQPAAPAPQPVP